MYEEYHPCITHVENVCWKSKLHAFMFCETKKIIKFLFLISFHPWLYFSIFQSTFPILSRNFEIGLAILVKSGKICLSLESVSFFFWWHPMILRLYLHIWFTPCIRAQHDKDKGARRERPLPTPLLFNDLRLFYYRAKIPAKVISVCTSKNRYPRRIVGRERRGGAGGTGVLGVTRWWNEPRGSEPENGLVEWLWL